MSKSDSITRHHLIIQKIRSRPRSFNEISHYLETESEIQAYNFNLSLRTFQRDLKDIRKIYNIDIQFDRLKSVYKINEEFNQGANERMFEAYEIFNALNLSDKLSEHFHFETRRPQGTAYLHSLLNAIKKEVQIQFDYLNFKTGEINRRKVEPYSLKEFRNRWYVISKDLEDENQEIKNFALDRISDLEITNTPFSSVKNFNVNDHFKHCFGIVGPNAEAPEELILSFPAYQGNFIKSLPLHTSQEILIDNEEELRIKLTVYITYDFEIELLSLGKNLKVIQPESFALKLKGIYSEAMAQYD